MSGSGAPVADVPVHLGPNPHALSYREARVSPCQACTATPCCNLLLLAGIEFNTLLDVDHASYLLNFDGILIELLQPGTSAQVYLQQKCRQLDQSSGLCTVHNTPDQPAICVRFNSHTCGYRTAFTTPGDTGHPLLDRKRLAWFADQIGFDDHRRVVSVPDWETVKKTFAVMPMQRHPLALPSPDPVIEEWRSIVLSPIPLEGSARPLRRYDDVEVSSPCTGCEAYCCDTLVFSRAVPTSAAEVDFMRYCVGFPGVEIAVADDIWAVVVKTRCRHLKEGRCTVFGMDERPLECGYYDALSCAYRGRFGVPFPDDTVRVSHQQFMRFAASIIFDSVGKVLAMPPVQMIQSILADAERESVGLPARSGA